MSEPKDVAPASSSDLLRKRGKTSEKTRSRDTSPIHVESTLPQKQWYVLVVDDEPTQRLITARLLKRAGYIVDTAPGVDEALKLLAANPKFQLVVTDWDWENVDGVKLCREIRAQQHADYVYTILLTSKDAIEHLVSGLSAGADDYLTKPVLEPELLARLNTGKRIITLERKLRRLATMDALTTVFNRAHFNTMLPQELEKCAGDGVPLSIIMLDVDHFKKVNDTWGHQAGDAVLKHVTQAIRQRIRQKEWIARLGGEEFVVVLPQVALSDAEKIAEFLREAIGASSIEYDSQSISVTASFGVVGWQTAVHPSKEFGAYVDRLSNAADKAMYVSKSTGRNRVTVGDFTVR